MPEHLDVGGTLEKLSITSDQSHQASDEREPTTTMVTLETGDSNDADNVRNTDQVPHSSLHENVVMDLPPGSLRTFPPEIRQMIFNEVITAPNVPRNSLMDIITPSNGNLVEALRSERDQALYREALEIHYKKHTVELTEENFNRVQELSEDTLSLVNHLCISYR